MIKKIYSTSGKLLAVDIFKPTTAESCTICRSINRYLEMQGNIPRIDNLARHNLKRHLASGKHWEIISTETFKD